MATGTYVAESAFPDQPSFELGAGLKTLLKPVASLKLTVLLFALSIFIIFVGTLAQVEKDMWEVIELYFRSYVAWIDVQLFFPPSWFPALDGRVPGRFPVPGGFTIGVLMSANLVAAHLVRFKIQAKGPELLMGIAVIGVGSLITYWVIASGHSRSGLQGNPPFSWEMLWMVIRGSMFLIAIASGLALAMSASSSKAMRLGLLGAAIVFGALGVWAATTMPSPSSLRILWQLIQGGLAGIVLLIGCMLAFKKRAGIVLLHAGIALMMFSEFFVSKYAVEGRMSIREGETMNYVRDIRSTEIAVVNASNKKTDEVVVVPGSRLLPPRGFLGFGRSDEKVLVTDEKLPFDIYVQDYIKNADLGSLDLARIARDEGMIIPMQQAQARQVASENVGAFLVEKKFITEDQLKEIEAIRAKRIASNYADQGAAKEFVMEEVRAASGTDGGEVDFAGAYVEFRKKGTEESLGKYMLSQILAASDQTEKVEVDGATYDVALRFKRSYKPYSLSLKDVRKDDYLGTNTPMNYSSEVVVTESETQNKVGDYKIWMNNPLRYSGETFYQSGYTSRQQGGGVEATDLQVVTNTGWMMPYVGCMLVTVGMMVHFSGTLWRFLSRLSRKEQERPVKAKSIWDYLVPALVVLIFAGYVGSKMKPPSHTKAQMKVHDFGKLPVVYQGRIKPFDTLARNTLRIISNKETVDDFTKYEEGKRRQPQIPAVRWLLDVMAGAPEASKHRVFRIDNLDVLETLGLPRRKGFRYALEEFQDKVPILEKQLKETYALDEESRSFYQRKLIEVERRLRAARLIEVAFSRVIPPLPSQEMVDSDKDAAAERITVIQRMLRNLPLLEAELNKFQPPLAVPASTGDEEKNWVAFSTAWNQKFGSDLKQQFGVDMGIAGLDPSKAADLWDEMLLAYADGKTKAFNDSIAEYEKLLEAEAPDNLDSAKVGFENFFNYSQPFKYCLVMYIISFLLVGIGWMASTLGGGFSLVNRTAFWLLAFTFLVHTLALGARVYISGRPPITNLYSSAVFIGWAAVGFGLVLELLYGRSQGGSKAAYGMGIGNAMAAVAGFSTLQIAYALAADGDTFTVLQAVLDTQFWLATHVVCITLGYATTYAAGALGVIYLLSMAWRKKELSESLSSMIYGTLCFAIFFSFVGTVLGGLWADDSWGRFWGWDPKENGALIIVLWNALILHARWGGMVRQKGLAVLAVIGNITTSWSWFGVNELGVGLHSYGFTEGVLRNLGLFVISQLLIVSFGIVAMALYEGDKKKAVT